MTRDGQDPRSAAAAALRRLGHALVAHDADPELLWRVAEAAERVAAEVERCPRRQRDVAAAVQRLWQTPPADGARMSHYSGCVVSGAANPLGIGVEVRRDGDEAVADLRFGPAFEGAPERVHGGAVAAVFDDVMGYVLVLLGVPAYTGRLTVDYRAAVPVDTPLQVRARLAAREDRKLWMRASLRPAGGDEILAEAEALFIAVPVERLLAQSRR